MKGVILAGGIGSRLLPLTKVTNKHLLPVYKKPMIYYPLQTLVDAGMKDILIVTGPEHPGDFLKLLGSGKEWGVKFTYEIQENASGTAGALLLAKDFADNEDFITVLGDNVLLSNIKAFAQDFEKNRDSIKAKILLSKVKNPERYGVATVDGKKITSIEEKPKNPKSNLAITGVYMFTPDVFNEFSRLKPSPRGELELTDILISYLKQGALGFDILQEAWTDAGSFDALYEATVLMHELELKGLLKNENSR
ncbi:MAG: NTP transferase domain-containing protein [Candidatus Diapherotrites archaeon]|uniref:glucose-1-phosphate thymidylyltransferase n=2 Tax=Candidatus Iainarchaeum sp. TaxID=3101447 RepID=A0A7J4K0U8_9ARCH|nr:NTP transferase domain-containing protein [Candidatus Diapherotrites archaeon]HIH21126.1 NTP transferase domain-containing protein [Candidatus Diapherotrites archaeon]